jgi:galactonate dehydratase
MSLGIHYNTAAGEEDIGSYVKDAAVFAVEEGYVRVGSGVGLGIDVDEEAVRRLSQGAKAWRNGGFVGSNGEVREW